MEVAWKKKRRKKRKWIVPRDARKKQDTLKAEQEREYTKSGTRVRAVSQVSLSSLRAVECATTRSGPPRPSLSSRFFFHREGVRRKWRTLFSRGIIAHSFQGDTLFFFWKESTKKLSKWKRREIPRFWRNYWSKMKREKRMEERSIVSKNKVWERNCWSKWNVWRERIPRLFFFYLNVI